jgi:hypothetical protein
MSTKFYSKRHITLFLVALVLVCGCMPQATAIPEATREPSGFFMGLWHGMIVTISFIASLFDDSVRIYDVVNTGHWYDLGFVFGIGGAAGSATKSRSKSRSKKESDEDR